MSKYTVYGNALSVLMQKTNVQNPRHKCDWETTDKKIIADYLTVIMIIIIILIYVCVTT